MILIFVILVLVLAYFALILPRIIDKPDCAFLAMFKYAHRGLHGGKIYENTLPAFEAAVQNGYGIELDIQLSADKVPMVFHDDNLSRFFAEDTKISSLTVEEIKKYKFPDTEDTIPTLEEVLDAVNGKVPLLIELKGRTKDTEICEYFTEIIDNYAGNFAVQSFNPFYLRWMKNHRPQFVRGQLAESKYENVNFVFAFALSNLLVNFLSRPDFISYGYKKAKTLSLKLNKLLGAATLAWTVRDAETEEKCGKNFDTVIFEDYQA